MKLNEGHQETSGKCVAEGLLKQLVDERKSIERQPLTIEKVRNMNGLADLTETEAAEVVDSIKNLAALLFDMHCRKEQTCIDNQQVVCLNQENKAA